MNLMNEGVLPPNELDDRDERREESEAQMSDNETITDIIAEMRKDKGVYPNLMWDNSQVEEHDLHYADRLEAAHRRERGDCAKLREAIAKVIEIAEREWDAFRETPAMWEIHEICKAALAAPPRNCDRFATETDAQIAFLNEVWLIGVSNLDRDPFDGWTNEMKSAYSKWLLAPATEKEGGKNGNE